MAITNSEVIVYKKKLSIRQKIWNYMRRTRQFRLGDILVICEPSSSYLQKYLAALNKAGYVSYEGPRTPCTNREYVLIKNTGVIAPLVTDYGLHDYNLRKKIEFPTRSSKSNKTKYPQVIEKILNVLISKDEITKVSLSLNADISKAALDRWWKRLKRFGVIDENAQLVDKSHMKAWKASEIGNLKREEGKILYKVDKKRAKYVLEDIQSGAYSKLSSEMRHLWLNK